MVISCSAFNCTNRNLKGSEISFHRFPLTEARVNDWIAAVHRKNWMPTKYSYLCSSHFLPEDFHTPDAVGRRLLKPSAVPSIFDFSNYSKKTKKQSLEILYEPVDTFDSSSLTSITAPICPRVSQYEEEDEHVEEQPQDKVENVEPIAEVCDPYEFEVFSQYVASELRQLPRSIQFKLKHKIQMAIIEAQKEHLSLLMLESSNRLSSPSFRQNKGPYNEHIDESLQVRTNPFSARCQWQRNGKWPGTDFIDIGPSELNDSNAVLPLPAVKTEIPGTKIV